MPNLHPHYRWPAAFLLAIGTLFLLFWFHEQHAPVSSHLPSFGRPDPSGSPKPSELLDDTQNATLGFEKIFVINLPSRADRRDSMSLAASLSGLDVIYADGSINTSDKMLPPGGTEIGLNQGSLDAWRAHVGVIREIVERNISSALVLEDDVDWDIRIKPQMRDFALASRLLVQPLNGTSNVLLDPTFPEPSSDQAHTDFNVRDAKTGTPTTSPYGDLDRWDLLWIGHCGCRFPQASDGNTPLGRAILYDDTTVPEKQHFDAEYGDYQLTSQYPDHTRVTSRARVNTCTLAYGISQPGARRLLYELGVHKMTGTTDMMFRSVCDGVDGRELLTCLTVQPQLFQHHRPIGDTALQSDISDHSGNYNNVAFTQNIRWSVRLNFEKLLRAATDYVDLFKDGEPGKHFASGK